MPVSVSLSPTTINPGGNITATYTPVPDRPTWLCYKSGNSAFTSPGCGNAGSSYTITSSGSGTTVQCTASESSASSIDLTLADSSQSNIRVRACTNSSDSLQHNNANVDLNVSKISIEIKDTFLHQGESLILDIINHVGDTPIWVCYRHNSFYDKVGINCTQSPGTGTLNEIDGQQGLKCTQSQNNADSVKLTWSNITQTHRGTSMYSFRSTNK